MVTGTSDSKIAAVYQFPDLEPIGVLKVIQPLFLVFLCNEFVFRDIGMWFLPRHGWTMRQW
jgi:hypothetical protein